MACVYFKNKTRYILLKCCPLPHGATQDGAKEGLLGYYRVKDDLMDKFGLRWAFLVIKARLTEYYMSSDNMRHKRVPLLMPTRVMLSHVKFKEVC